MFQPDGFGMTGLEEASAKGFQPYPAKCACA